MKWMKQRTKNLRLQIIQSSMHQAILTYSSVVKTSWKIDATCEQVCMATPKEKYYVELLKYQWERIAESKENYYTELNNNITNFNDNNNTSLSNAKIQEAVMRVTREDKEGEITDANNVTNDTWSLVSSSQRENLNAMFTSEKLEKSDELVDAVKNMKMNDVGYELNTTTKSDAQVNITSNLDTVTHTINGIIDQIALR